MPSPRALVGPVPLGFTAQHLADARRSGDCLTFGAPDSDVPFPPGERWDTLQAGLPTGWQPDFLLLNLAYSVLPHGFESTSIPLIGYAADWPLHWHYYRQLAIHLDRVWIDEAGAARLAAAGVANARAVMPFGRTFTSEVNSATVRDIDLLWVGNFNPAIHPDRNRFVARIAAFSPHSRVQIVPGLDRRVIRPLLLRSRVAFLPSFHGGWDDLVADALAAGATVVRDAPIPDLEPDREYVLFEDGQLEETLAVLLSNRSRCESIAANGHARANAFTTPARWTRAVASLETDWEALASSAARRIASRGRLEPELFHWQALNARTLGVQSSLTATPDERLAGATLAAWSCRRRGDPTDEAHLRSFQDLVADPRVGPSAAIHLAELLGACKRGRDSVPLLRKLLEFLASRRELGSPTDGFGPLRPGFDAFRVAWERTAWANLGDPDSERRQKRDLLRARCEFLLGLALDDPARVVRSAAFAPDFFPTAPATAAAAIRVGATTMAITLAVRCFREEPFSPDRARLLQSAWERSGDASALDRHHKNCAELAAATAKNVDATLPAESRRPQRVSLAMIVKNEEANLAACLDSVRDLVGEIVVVETGSTDRTPHIAASRGARIVPFAWCDDFAAARNAGLEVARGDWIFWLDADERLEPIERDEARRLFASLRDENAAYMMRQLSPSENATGATTAVDQVRLFRRRPDVRWEYRIHEQILLSLRRSAAIVRSTGITIHHTGYESAELRDRKMVRNTRLLELAHREKPDDPILAFNLAWVYHKATRAGEALPLLEYCLKTLAPRVSIVPKIYRLLGQVLSRLGRTSEALTAFASGRELYPTDIELLLHHGLLLQRIRDYPAAEACFRRILALPPGNYLGGLDLSLKGYKAHNALADLFLEQGRLGEAEVEWRKALAESPDFGPAHVGLASVALARGRRREAEAILDRLVPSDPDTSAGVERLRRALQTNSALVTP